MNHEIAEGVAHLVGMMTHTQWALYAVAEIIVFLSYHLIPHSMRTAKVENAAAASKSGIFEAFVRFCGNDHAVMLFCMYALAAGWSAAGGWAAWTLVGHSCLTAAVSAYSAYELWGIREKIDVRQV